MGKRIRKEFKLELIEALRERYGAADNKGKAEILDEFVAVAGYHRKHAIRLLGKKRSDTPHETTSVRGVYNDAVREAVVVLWEAADRICGKRLKEIIPTLLCSMERHGHLALEAAVREGVLAASAATLDRLLAPVRKKAKSRKKKRTPKSASREIPIKTFADWNEPTPLYLQR